LDGKYLLSTSDDTLSAEDVALGYRQLLQVEACFRSLKTQVEIRPVYHRLEARIRAHDTLCWLALLLARICEEKTGRSWEEIRTIMGRLSLVTYHGAEGEAQQCTEATPDQAQIFSALGVAPPLRMYALPPPPRPHRPSYTPRLHLYPIHPCASSYTTVHFIQQPAKSGFTRYTCASRNRLG
jgi:hypothetical protein